MITNIISSYNFKQYSLKIALVGHRDHEPEAKEYVKKQKTLNTV